MGSTVLKKEKCISLGANTDGASWSLFTYRLMKVSIKGQLRKIYDVIKETRFKTHSALETSRFAVVSGIIMCIIMEINTK